MRKVTSILAVTVAVLSAFNCANTTGVLRMTMPDTPQFELSNVAEVMCLTDDELVVRFHETVLFEVNQYNLKPGAEQNLNQVAEILMKYPDFIIIVEGHTDNSGRESFNQWISERRSFAVADFLVSRGVDPDRILVIGYGEKRPIASNRFPEGRQRNRRVELHLIPIQP